MRYLCAILCLTLVSCGGSGPVGSIISTQTAQAQTSYFTNLSANTGPLNQLMVTNPGTGITNFVTHIVPTSVQANGCAGNEAFLTPAIAMNFTVGQPVTISHSLLMNGANDGTYNVTQTGVVSHLYGGVCIACPSCVEIDNETGELAPPNRGIYGCAVGNCAIVADGLATRAVTDSNGTIHWLVTSTSGGQGSPYSLVRELTSPDGVTWTVQPNLFDDTPNPFTCHSTDGTPNNDHCQWSVGMAENLPNGNIIAFATKVDTGFTILTAGYKIYDIHARTWGSFTTLPGKAPDGIAWYGAFGQAFIVPDVPSMICTGGFMSNTNDMYVGCSCDNGVTWGQANCNGGFKAMNPNPPDVNEGITMPIGNGKMLSIWRTDQTASLTACSHIYGGTACGTFKICKSANMGTSWTCSLSSVGATQAETRWELVDPKVYCRQLTSDCILYWGERDYTLNPSSHVVTASFNPQTLYGDPTAISVPRIIANGHTNVNPGNFGYNYITARPQGGVLIAWYDSPANVGFTGYKLYYMTADLTPSTGIAISHSQVIGTLR